MASRIARPAAGPSAMLTATARFSSTTGDGAISATEGDLETFLSREGSQEADFITFPVVTSLSIETEISLSAGPFSSASAMSVSNLFSSIYSVPEPSTWAMMLIGFAGLGYAGWRRRSKLGVAAT